jgi:hypothetical protein
MTERTSSPGASQWVATLNAEGPAPESLDLVRRVFEFITMSTGRLGMCVTRVEVVGVARTRTACAVELVGEASFRVIDAAHCVFERL